MVTAFAEATSLLIWFPKSVVAMPPWPKVGSSWPACAIAWVEATSTIEKINKHARCNAGRECITISPYGIELSLAGGALRGETTTGPISDCQEIVNGLQKQ